MTSSVSRRINHEIEHLNKNLYDEFTYGPYDDDIYYWRATIKGQPKTKLAGMSFELEITVPRLYPLKGPIVRFMNTRSKSCTSVCSDLGAVDWSPALTIDKMILSVVALLHDSSPEKLKLLASISS